MQVLSEAYQKELAQGVISVLDKALEGYSKLDKHQLGIITAQQVMAELEVSYNTLKRWEEAGLKRYQPPVEDSRKVYYRISDILAFLGVENNGKP